GVCGGGRSRGPGGTDGDHGHRAEHGDGGGGRGDPASSTWGGQRTSSHEGPPGGWAARSACRLWVSSAVDGNRPLELRPLLVTSPMGRGLGNPYNVASDGPASGCSAIACGGAVPSPRVPLTDWSIGRAPQGAAPGSPRKAQGHVAESVKEFFDGLGSHFKPDKAAGLS